MSSQFYTQGNYISWDLETSDVITNPSYIVLEMSKCPSFQKGGKRPTATSDQCD